MFNLILHNIFFGLFDVYFFLSYWFLRITFLDRLVEMYFLKVAKNAKINVRLAYKGSQDENEMNIMNGDSEDKWPTLTVYDRRISAKIAPYPTLGLGEAFINGWIDGDENDVTGAWRHILEVENENKLFRWHFLFRFWNWLLYDCVNNQTKAGVKRLMKTHYNLGNDIFERLLGPMMLYSCGYWRNATNVDEAQMAKLELIAQKLKLRPGMRVLDIGACWGTLATYLSTKYDVHVTAVTPSTEGVHYITEKYKGNTKIEVICCDYRDMKNLGSFDRITAIESWEHVSHKNHRNFIKICRERLKDDGILFIQITTTILSNPYAPRMERFIDKYVFPGAELFCLMDVTKAIDHLFIIEDLHNFGPYYWKTSEALSHNLIRHKDYIVSKYGLKTYRIFFAWLRGAVVFEYRLWQNWQIVLSKKGLMGGYESVR